MAGISSKAAGKLQNKDKTFQGQKFDDDLGINYVEFKYRNHDPQIGRFIEIDPLANDYVYNSTYAFSENKVTHHVELEGLESCDIADMVNNDKYGAHEISGDELSRRTHMSGVSGMVGTGIVLSFMYPGTASLIMLSSLTGVPLNGSPQMMAETTVATATETNLQQRATEIQGALKPATQSRTTTAVASATTAEGQTTTLVASSEKVLRPAQIAALKPGETAVSGAGHAETTILNHAKANNITVNAVAASRPICAGCATAINNAGATTASPLKAYAPVITNVAVSTYVQKPPIIPLKN